MKEIFKCFFSIFLLFFFIWPVNAIDIIERSEWWANEEFRYRESSYWEDIIAKRAVAKKYPATASSKAAYAKQQRVDSYLVNNFSDDLEIVDSEYFFGDNKLAWPEKKTNYIKSIVVHHTHSEYESSEQWIKNIYKYHSLSNQWWDIGYNYIIGYGGEIYEWRAGWDYVIAAHAKNNNFSTVWIALMWDFEHNDVPEAQAESLSQLVKFLAEKYGIDLSKRFPIHKPCIASDNCEYGWDVKTTYHYPLVGHIDAAHTSCPGEHLYDKLEEIRQENLSFTKWFTPISYEDSLKSSEEKYWNILNVLRWAESKRLIWIIANINRAIKNKDNTDYIGKLKIIRSLVLQVLRERG